MTKAKHVAIIMDGNGRWAKQRLMPRALGHQRGVEAVRRAVRAAGELGLEVLTLMPSRPKTGGGRRTRFPR